MKAPFIRSIHCKHALPNQGILPTIIYNCNISICSRYIYLSSDAESDCGGGTHKAGCHVASFDTCQCTLNHRVMLKSSAKAALSAQAVRVASFDTRQYTFINRLMLKWTRTAAHLKQAAPVASFAASATSPRSGSALERRFPSGLAFFTHAGPFDCQTGPSTAGITMFNRACWLIRCTIGP